MTDGLLVSDETMQRWLGLCEGLASPLVGLANAELDDLVQEGWIFCWDSLRRGVHPSKAHVRHRMLNWCRYLQRLDRCDPMPYEQAMEELDNVHDWRSGTPC